MFRTRHLVHIVEIYRTWLGNAGVPAGAQPAGSTLPADVRRV